MKKDGLKIFKISVLLGLIFSILISFVSFDAKCDEIRDNVLRLHILANSDSEKDQALKLKIRDAILNLGLTEFECCTNLQQAISVAQDSTRIFKETALGVIKDNGFDYDVNITVGKAYFETRVYDEFTLPAGEYDALCVEIGKAEGKNWWCVMFPALCVPAATEASLEDCVGSDSAVIATQPQKYQIRFKTVEIFEKIKKNILNK